MNGIVASIIMSGDGAKQADIERLEKELALMRTAYGSAVEIVLHFSKPTELVRNDRLIVFTSSKKISPFQSAVVVSSGEKLLFTTLRNFQIDEKNKALNQALDTPIKKIAAPLTRTILGKLGAGRGLKTPYLAAERGYVLGLVAKADSLVSLLDHATRQPGITELPAVGVAFPDYVMLSQFSLPAKGPTPKKRRTASTQSHLKFSENIPVFIICRDRVEPLKELVEWCEDEGLKNIIFIDNDSSYPPLLKYYSKTPYEVIRLNYNVGYLSPWMTGAVNIYAPDLPYIISDADVIPEPDAHGAISLFCRLLNKYPRFVKAGFGLKIDDIPAHYEPRDYVLSWESQFWQKKVEEDVYEADIDTTFCLCRPNLPHTYGPSLRTGGRFVAKHETWYMDSKKPSAEMRYYREHVDKVIGTWGAESSELQDLYVNHKNKAARKKIKK